MTGIEPRGRARHYLQGPNGLIIELDELNSNMQSRIAEGELEILTEAQILRYLTTGSPDA